LSRQTSVLARVLHVGVEDGQGTHGGTFCDVLRGCGLQSGPLGGTHAQGRSCQRQMVVIMPPLDIRGSHQALGDDAL
jgi:hypothetical protein